MEPSLGQPSLPCSPRNIVSTAGQGRQLQRALECLRVALQVTQAAWSQTFWAAENKCMDHLPEAPPAALYAVKEHIELLLGPCRHKGIHHIAGCADAAAGSQKGIVVQLIVTCSTT